jgi:peptide/nickel transport system permease protein
VLRTFTLKFLRLVLVVIVVTFITFLLTKLQPGDPVSKIIPFGTEQQKAELRADLGLDKPMLQQYGIWLKNFATGNFGKYYDSQQSVNTVLKQSLPVSLELMIYAQILALAVAIPLGVTTAYRAGSRYDRSANATMFALLALPNFVLALMLAIYVGAKWQLLPTQSNVIPFPLNPLDNWRYMLMPVVALTVGQIAVYMRLLRSDMIATLQEDFITTAKAKGIPTRRILWRHALRPSSLTLLTVAGLNVGALIGGALVVENVFGVPGLGKRITEAILAKQYPALQSYVAIVAILYVVINFIIDILYSVLDPRIRNARAVA